MQAKQAYSGTVTLGSSASRTVSWNASTTLTVYASHVNWVNNKIAAFLTARGVPATWTNGGWLYIHGVPLLFCNAYNNNYFRLYIPGLTSTFFSVSGALPASAYNGTAMKVTCFFTGTPDAFCLRLAGYSSTTPQAAVCLRVVKGINVLNGHQYVCLCGGSGSVGNYGHGLWYLYDVESGSPNTSYLPTVGIYAPSHVACTAVHKNQSPNKYPLVPMPIGPVYNARLWMHPTNLSIPAAAAYTVEAQTTLSSGGRKFIVTCPESVASGYINMGLLEDT